VRKLNGFVPSKAALEKISGLPADIEYVTDCVYDSMSLKRKRVEEHNDQPPELLQAK